MDDSELMEEFSQGTWDLSRLNGRVFTVEVVTGFQKGGFSGEWVKRFSKNGRTGFNELSGVRFGFFECSNGAFFGYGCVKLDYNVLMVGVSDYMRYSREGYWLGVYVVDGSPWGWFRLREVVN